MPFVSRSHWRGTHPQSRRLFLALRLPQMLCLWWEVQYGVSLQARQTVLPQWLSEVCTRRYHTYIHRLSEVPTLRCPTYIHWSIRGPYTEVSGVRTLKYKRSIHRGIRHISTEISEVGRVTWEVCTMDRHIAHCVMKWLLRVELSFCNQAPVLT
mgnify:CR=1 FL=1